LQLSDKNSVFSLTLGRKAPIVEPIPQRSRPASLWAPGGDGKRFTANGLEVGEM
jgi:hypothetical protein